MMTVTVTVSGRVVVVVVSVRVVVMAVTAGVIVAVDVVIVAPRVSHNPSIPQGGILGKSLALPLTPVRDPWCRGRAPP